jgi:hypothetical protein
VCGAWRTKCLTTSGREKAPTFADIEEKYLAPDEETEAQRTRRKANKRKVVSRFNAELRRQAENEVQTARELNTGYAWIIREQNTRRRAERGTELYRKNASKLDKLMQYT